MTRVLVVDDETNVLTTVAMIFRIKGFEVVAVNTGADGLREFDTSKFDLVVVDMFLKGAMDGVNVIELLRERSPNLPVIAMSGVVPLDFLTRVPDLPDVPCLSKPFRPNELMAAVTAALANRSL